MKDISKMDIIDRYVTEYVTMTLVKYSDTYLSIETEWLEEGITSIQSYSNYFDSVVAFNNIVKGN